MTQTVAVDFDGVIHAYTRGWQDGSIYDPPIPGALDALRILMQRYAVAIHTSRDAHQVAPWLVDLGFPVRMDGDPDSPEFWNAMGVLFITNRKIPAVAYIDDRGIRFENWDQALADLQRHTAR